MKKQVVPIDILAKVQANIEGALGQVDKLQKHLSTLEFPEGSTKKLTSSIDKIIERVRDFEYAAKQGVNSLEDAKKLEKSWKGVLDLLNKAGVRLEELGKVEGIFPKDVADNIDKATKAMKEYKKARELAYGAQAYKDLKAQEEAAVSNKKKAINSRESKKIAAVSSKANLEQEKETKQWKTRGKEYQELIALVKGYDDTIKAEKRYREELVKTNKFLTEKGEVRQKGVSQQDREGQEYKNAIKAAEEYAEASGRIEEMSQEREKLVNSQNYQALLEDAKAIEKLEERYAKANVEVTEAEARYEAAEKAVQRNTEAVKDFVETQTKASWSELSDSLKGLGASSDDIDKVKQNLGEVNAIVQSYQAKHIEDVAATFAQAEQALEEFGKEAKVVQNQNEQTTQSLEAMNRQAEEMEGLKNSILQFFSITNAVQLFKSAVNSAMQTVKELDATMTEAAVVTEFDVSDMWDKLPTYSAQAQKLGVSINGMYQATTLYYQQGLKTNEAMALGVETMKMAKIAGMESADATKAMTAALRGFNMELNETSAARVNDVYSELAAVTAADTAQIADAMSKTASIAASANMEFETTAALLAQIIETTQEAPETAGTALKTIVARFSEVKSLREQGMISGQDLEGEGIDVNKIQTALKTVGISMEGFFAGTEGLDSILLKLAEKWPKLNTETQRYIATMAAGSRQQSRFIAMMSDYGRTTELVAAANESAGASQKQFEKTLESMETKVQKLENAWNQFLMGLANNEVLKGVVDFLSTLVESLNKTIDAVSGGNGLTKSIISLVAALGGLKAGKTLLSGFALQEEDLGNGKVAKRIVYAGRGSQEKSQPGLLGSTRNVLSGKTGAKTALKGFFTQSYKEADREGINEIFSTIYKNDNKRKRFKNTKKEKEIMAEFDTNGADAAIKKYEELNDVTLSAEQKQEILNAQIEKSAINFQAVGQAAMVAGGAVGLLASAFESAGWEAGANALEKVSVALMGVGAGLQVLSAIVPVVESVFAGASKKIAIAGVTASAAWLWVLGIAAAVAAVVAIGIAVAKAAREASNEFKLEKLNEQIGDMTEQAEAAKQVIDDITATREGLEQLEDTFAGLTKGSKEWKEALINNNQQVLELIDKYPELLSYMTRGEHGQLTISDEGWDAVISSQQARYVSASNAKLDLQNQASNLELKIQAEKLTKQIWSGAKKTYQKLDVTEEDDLNSDTITTSSDETATRVGNLTRENFDLFMDQFMASGLDVDKEGKRYAQDLYEELANTSSGFSDLWAAMEDMRGSLEKARIATEQAKQLEIERNRIIAENLAGTSDVVSDSEFEDAVTYASAQAYENREEKVETAKVQGPSSNADKGVNNGQNAEIIRQYREAFNLQEEEVKNALKNGTLTYETMKNQLATKKIDDEQVKAMENLTRTLEGLDKTVSGRLAGLMTKGGLGLAYGQLENIRNGGDLSKYLANAFGINDDQKDTFAQGIGYADWNAYVTAMQLNLDDAGKAWEFALNRFSGLLGNSSVKTSLENFAKNNQLTIEQTQALSNNLAEIIVQGGNANEILSNFDTMLQGLSGDNLQQALDILTRTDWTVQSSVDSTVEALRALGVNLDKDFVQQIYDAANTVKQFSTEQLEANLKTLQGAMEVVSGKADEGSKRYTAEEYNALLTAGVASKEDFIRTGIDEYVYLDETNKLLSEIRDKVGLIIDDGRENLQAAVDQGELYEKAFNSTEKFVAHSTTQGAVYATADEMLTGIIEGNTSYSGTGVMELAKSLGIENVESLTYEGMLEAIKTGYNDYYLKLKENREKLEQLMQEELSIALAGRAGTQDFMNDLGGENAGKAVEVIEALIGSVAGLTTAEEQFLYTLGGVSRGHENLVKNLVYGNYLANKSMDELNATLDEQAEDFKINDLNSGAYRAALEKVTIAAKKVFGKGVTKEFVHANNNLFSQLMAGGEVAQKAYEELGLLAAESYAKGLSLGEGEIKEIRGLLEGALGASAVGEAIDVTELAKTLAEKYGIGIESALKIIETAGFTVRGDGDSVFAVREDAQGLGFNDFGSDSSANLGDPYDKFYNQLQLINEELRKREKYEREYQRLLRQERGASGKEILDNVQQQRNTLAAQEHYWKEIQKGREEQLINLTKNSKYNGYAAWNETLQTIVIDNAALEELRLSNSEEYDKVSKYISELERYQDGFDEATDALWDIEDELYELNQQGRDEYLNLETRIKDALVAARQAEIDELQAINDTISSSNEKILSSMNEVINEQRKARDNEKIEKSLSDKRTRLAYLQTDTSGANALEILKLQKEIAEEEESYTDSLVDQRLEELQKQNDKAAEQRQLQIDIMRSQLDYDIKNGVFWSEVQRLLNTGISNTGEIISDGELETLLQKQDNWKGLSKMGKQDWFQELQTTAGLAWSWLNGNEETGEESAYVKGLDNSLKTATDDLLNGLKGLLDGKWPEETEKVGGDGGQDITLKIPGEKEITYTHYASGGLNTSTGPAWLDGTKSNPEYVLNAQQTKAFLSLVDILGNFNSNNSNPGVGDVNVDVDINIETVKEEADVDMLAEKMKKVIVDAARFRNNNTL